MIKYKMRCHLSHEFDCWFRDITVCRKQLRDKEIECPFCHSRHVEKMITAPNISLKSAPKQVQSKDDQALEIIERTIGQKVPKELAHSLKSLKPYEVRYIAAKALQRTAEKYCKNVGDQFAEEVRKMHYGEKTKESIMGYTSLAEAERLREENIDIGVIPIMDKEDS